VLQIPTLVQLGYGGVPSPFVFKDDDDVSSWGSEGENAVNADEKIVRSRSFSRILRASMHGRPVSVTAEEKEVIARLASIAESFPNREIGDKDDASRPLQNVHQQAELSTKENASPKESMKKKDEATSKASISISSTCPVDHSDSFPAPNHQSVVEVCPTPTSIRGGRRVVKAGRRFLSSLSAMAQRVSDDVGETSVSTGKKRTAESLSSSLSVPAKVSRRNNTWAFKQRKKDAHKINKVLSFKETEKEGTQTPTKTTPKKAVVVEDDDGNISQTPVRFTPSSSSIKRHPFTEDEVNAILEGVKLHGVGHWTVIQESDERLTSRKPGQLKDKYRTMLNRGEV
jgi:Myb-like DNA-binding domain